jgi:hypothetical protein
MHQRMKLICEAVINVASRHRNLRGPFILDEDDLQAQAEAAKKWLKENK